MKPGAGTTATLDGEAFRDTIVAVATPSGRGALATIRLSGTRAFEIARRHIVSWPQSARTAHLSTVQKDASVLDESIVTLFPAPHSFTGEDSVEISSHGGYLVPASIVEALIGSGARLALPGEFTRRAVLNGKIDVLQAEAIGDLIDASSHAMQRTALEQLDGGLSRRLLELRAKLIGLEALIAYDVDFPEEDDGPIPRERIEKETRYLIDDVKSLLATSRTGELVREGALVVIAGPPNVGKSSLFNALLGKSRAIVTEIPGTTRDALEAVIDGNPWPLRVVDTAGLRETSDRIERLGIEVSQRYLNDADVVLACDDDSGRILRTSELIAEQTSAPVICIRTKADLVATSAELHIVPGVIPVSAETGEGFGQLTASISSVLADKHGGMIPDSPMLTRARHRHLLSTACSELEQFEHVWASEKVPAVVSAVHLRTAVVMLEELLGAIDVEEVLDRLFSSFCVGK
jgi:tRNA modification GTPase